MERTSAGAKAREKARSLAPQMKSYPIRIGVFDQIVSGGGVRFFTVKLLEEFSRLAENEWRFRLMWPLFDSSNNFLPRPNFENVSFERISLDVQSTRRNMIVSAVNKFSPSVRLFKRNVNLLRQFEGCEETICLDEQKKLRAGDGQGLRWLDERADQFDLLYLPYPYLTLPGSEDWRPSKPLVITLHDLAHEQTDAWGDLTENLQHEVRRWTQLADLVIFSSDSIKNEAQKLYELPEERSKRIYLAPAKPERLSRQSDVHGRFGLNKRYIFTLGWAARHKRLDTIIEGFAIFKNESGADLALVLAGPNTESLASNNYGLEPGKDIFAVGYVGAEDIPALYQSAEAVVTASISEAGLNAMILDAMNYERPVICSNIPQFIERLGSDESLALTFDPYSPQALADALAEHFKDPEKARWRASKAKKFIDSRTLSDVGRDYLAAFKSVLGKAA